MPLARRIRSSEASGSAPALEAAARIASPRTRSRNLLENASAFSARSFAALICLSTSARRRSVRLSSTSSIFPAAISFASSSSEKRWRMPRTASGSIPSKRDRFSFCCLMVPSSSEFFDFRPVTSLVTRSSISFWISGVISIPPPPLPSPPLSGA